jgi:hypothetical protein
MATPRLLRRLPVALAGLAALLGVTAGACESDTPPAAPSPPAVTSPATNEDDVTDNTTQNGPDDVPDDATDDTVDPGETPRDDIPDDATDDTGSAVPGR